MCLRSGRPLPAAERSVQPLAMQAFYTPKFERDMGLTAQEFRRCLPGAFEPLPVQWEGAEAASVAAATGTARLQWHALPPRVIALMTLARVHVSFDFGAINEDERQRLMRRFDLVMLRGGG